MLTDILRGTFYKRRTLISPSAGTDTCAKCGQCTHDIIGQTLYGLQSRLWLYRAIMCLHKTHEPYCGNL